MLLLIEVGFGLADKRWTSEVLVLLYRYGCDLRVAAATDSLALVNGLLGVNPVNKWSCCKVVRQVSWLAYYFSCDCEQLRIPMSLFWGELIVTSLEKVRRQGSEVEVGVLPFSETSFLLSQLFKTT